MLWECNVAAEGEEADGELCLRIWRMIIEETGPKTDGEVFDSNPLETGSKKMPGFVDKNDKAEEKDACTGTGNRGEGS